MGADVVVVGSGPNGLVAANVLVDAGAQVTILEQGPEPGGGVRSAELTAPGYIHDVCSSVHPLGAASPELNRLHLDRYGLEWIRPAVQLAHPLDDGSAAAVYHSMDETAAGLGADGSAWRSAVGLVANHWPRVGAEILRPLVHVPRHPATLARMAPVLAPIVRTARRFSTEAGQALWAGLGAHSTAPLESWATSAVAGVLGGLAHVEGWPIARGGSGAIAKSLIDRFTAGGGEIRTGHRVESRSDLPRHRVALYDTGVRTLLDVYGHSMPSRYARRLRRFRPGPGVFKVDYLLAAPIPWTAPSCRQATTVHVGGTLDEIAEAERAPWQGHAADRPFVLVGQPTVVDPSRAPGGSHIAWAYCHVPNGWRGDHGQAIERQIERFAPGFGDLVSQRAVFDPARLESENPNFVGGDIATGASRGLQIFARPTWSPNPYRTPIDGVYLCSAASPPGGGVHGIAGARAARSVLADDLG